MSALTQLLYEAALKGGAGYIGKRGTTSLIDWILSLNAGQALSETDEVNVKKLVSSPFDALDRVLPYFKWTDSRGILFVGPSGVGKTSLVTSLAGEEHTSISTASVEAYKGILGGRITAIRSCPGLVTQASEIRDSVRKSEPVVLGLVVANGYADPIGTDSHLRVPASSPDADPFVDYGDDLKAFLSASLRHETDWLEAFLENAAPPKRKAQYLMFVANKRDLWCDKAPRVMQRYREGSEKRTRLLSAIAQKFAIKGAGFQFVSTASEVTQSFKKRKLPPDPHFDSAKAEDSIRTLRALLCVLLSESRE